MQRDQRRPCEVVKLLGCACLQSEVHIIEPDILQEEDALKESPEADDEGLPDIDAF